MYAYSVLILTVCACVRVCVYVYVCLRKNVRSFEEEEKTVDLLRIVCYEIQSQVTTHNPRATRRTIVVGYCV